jgi:hypothetical protein
MIAIVVRAGGRLAAGLACAVWLPLALACLWSPCAATACQVPVFRYALERWEPVPYKAVVFHRGTLNDKDRRVVDLLGKAAEDPKQPANIEVQAVDLAGDCPLPLKELHKKVSPPTLPWLVLVQPENPERESADGKDDASGDTIVWSGPLDRAAAGRVLDSPLRRELARRLLKGDSAVWMLLESGDRAKDAAAVETISVNLKKLQNDLAAALDRPDGPDSPPDDGPLKRVSPGVPLHVAFSLLRVSRRDAAEDVLVKMLLATEPKLKNSTGQPVAAIVFGRGRVLGSLVGKEIEADAIASGCQFLVADCSCMVKDSRMCGDLLMSVDWNGPLERGLVDKALPPLTGVMPAGPPAEQASAAAPTTAETDPAAGAADDGLVRNVTIAFVAVLVVVVIGSVLIRRRFGER